ncbi:unnamed protein product [Allacma fusca]|uniref:Uncharacterized protein n=1 Tax=Allacma fusca TaxID=39272 RepID=A0A8J2P4M3_9HEXA|nr:unnamed protein product [Allacma fusca]
MKSFALSACIALILCSTLASEGIHSLVKDNVAGVAKVVDDGASLVINQWVDTLMDSTLKQIFEGLIPIDPIKLPIVHPSLGINLNAQIFDVTLNGLNSLHRVGVANTEIDVATMTALVTFDAGITNMNINASMEINTYFKLGPPVKISGNLGYGIGTVVVKMGTGIASPYAELVSFKLMEIGNFTMKVEGLGTLLNGLAGQLTVLVFNALKEPIRQQAEITLRDVISKALEKSPPALSIG